MGTLCEWPKYCVLQAHKQKRLCSILSLLTLLLDSLTSANGCFPFGSVHFGLRRASFLSFLSQSSLYSFSSVTVAQWAQAKLLGVSPEAVLHLNLHIICSSSPRLLPHSTSQVTPSQACCIFGSCPPKRPIAGGGRRLSPEPSLFWVGKRRYLPR